MFQHAVHWKKENAVDSSQRVPGSWTGDDRKARSNGLMLDNGEMKLIEVRKSGTQKCQGGVEQ